MRDGRRGRATSIVSVIRNMHPTRRFFSTLTHWFLHSLLPSDTNSLTPIFPLPSSFYLLLMLPLSRSLFPSLPMSHPRPLSTLSLPPFSSLFPISSSLSFNQHFFFLMYIFLLPLLPSSRHFLTPFSFLSLFLFLLLHHFTA